MMGNKPSMSPHIFDRDENVGIAYGMGLTAEKVAEQWKVSREAQDAFSVESHRKAIAAQQAGEFNDEIDADRRSSSASRIWRPARSTSRPARSRSTKVRAPTRRIEGLAKLRPVFATKGSVTAGNSSQTSDGAGALIVVSREDPASSST